jgi:hypothetical protein
MAPKTGLTSGADEAGRAALDDTETGLSNTGTADGTRDDAGVGSGARSGDSST